MIFHVEWAVFGINASPRPLAGLIKFRERRDDCTRSGLRKNLQKGETIIDCTVAIVEISGLADQIAELAALEAARGPVNFRDRTGPRLMDKDRRKRLTEGAIKAGIVSDDEMSAGIGIVGC